MKIESILKEKKNRVTPERVAIFDFLKTKHIFDYNDIADKFGDIGRASIFRTLNLFLELGVIRKVEVGGKSMTYELIDEKHHHEHMKCEKCESVISFESHKICQKIMSEAKKIGFEVKSHNIGILGRCKECQIK